MGNMGPLLAMPLFLSNFVQKIIMFFNIVGQGFTPGYCGRNYYPHVSLFYNFTAYFC